MLYLYYTIKDIIMKKVYKILQPRLLLIPPWLSRNSVGHGEPQYLGSNRHGLDVLRLLPPDNNL